MTSGSMSFNNGNVILGLQMPPSQTMYNNAFNNLRGIKMNSRQNLKQDCLSNFTDELLSQNSINGGHSQSPRPTKNQHTSNHLVGQSLDGISKSTVPLDGISKSINLPNIK